MTPMLRLEAQGSKNQRKHSGQARREGGLPRRAHPGVLLAERETTRWQRWQLDADREPALGGLSRPAQS